MRTHLILTLALITPAAPRAQPPSWSEQSVMRISSLAGLVFDTRRDRLVLHGRHDAIFYGYGMSAARTWEWSGGGWTRRAVAGPPPRRDASGMAFDAARGRTVLFGGEQFGAGDTWEFDGLSWVQRSPASSPPGRGQHALVYDPVRQRVVLFGGRRLGNHLADTWEWDGTDWRQRAPAAAPPARADHAMAWDPITQRVLLFGGLSGTAFLADTWAWDGNQWTQLSPAQAPQARWRHAMAGGSRVVLHGGNNASTLLDDTWEWDGTGWSARTTQNNPPVMFDPAMAWDPRRQRTVLHGTGTWSYDGIDWRLDAAFQVPAGRADHAITYHAPDQNVVVFGGSDGGFEYPSTLSDTWIWDGGWRSVTAGGPRPRLGATLVYHPPTRRSLLFGGWRRNGYSWTLYDDTWQWDGSFWTLLPKGPADPAERYGHAMAYHERTGDLLLFGGDRDVFGSSGSWANDTWTWNGTWTQHAVSGPQARGYHAMAYDPRRHRTVLFGGMSGYFQVLGDTWEWDGTSWLSLTPATSPPPGGLYTMEYHPGLRRVLLFGDPRNPVWAWDGVDWAALGSLGALGVRPGAAVTLDPDRGAIVSIGGASSAGILENDVWLLGSSAVAESIGGGCGGPGGAPLATAFGSPSIGNGAFAIDVDRAAATSPALLIVSSQPASVPLGGGCVLRADPTVPFGLVTTSTNGFGHASFAAPIPADPTLLGAQIVAQAFIADPQGPWAGISVTAGLAMTLGW